MKITIITVRSVIAISIMLLVAMSFYTPQIYNFKFNTFVFGILTFNVLLYFWNWNSNRYNYMDFEPIFIIISLILGFVFPLAIFPYDNGTAYLFSFGKSYNLNNINRGTLLTAVALSSFLLGTLNYGKVIKKNSFAIQKRINSTFVFLLLLLFLLLFLLLGGFSHYKELYQNDVRESSITTYFECFVVTSAQVLLFNEYWNKSQNRKYRLNKLYFIVVVVISFLFLIVGARTQAAYIALPAIIFFSKLYYKVSFRIFLLFLLAGMGVMSFIQFFRAGYDYNLDMEWYYFISDMLIPNTNTYLACEIVDKSGYTFGQTMLIGLLSVFPFAQSVFNAITGLGLQDLSSAHMFTAYLGTNSGMGTNYVADAFLAFGIIGVSLFPFFLGKILSNIKKYQFYSFNKTLFYYIICSFAVFLVRCSILFPLRFIFYAYIISSLNIFFNRISWKK